jgi:hypothetical protein
MRNRLFLFVAAMTALLAACAGGAREFDLPLSEVQHRLTELPREANVFGLLAELPGVAHWQERDGDRLVWHFTLNGQDYARYHAELTAVGDARTRVATRFEEAEEAVVASPGRRGSDLAFFRETARIAADESVAAALEGRAADTSRIRTRLAAHIVADPMAVARSAGEMMKEMNRDSSGGQ